MAERVILNQLDYGSEITYYGTVGIVAVAILSAITVIPNYPLVNRKFLQIHNPSNSNSLQFTLDGATPILNSVGIWLLPGSTATYDYRTLQGPLLIVGSDVNSPYTIVVV